MDFNKDNAVGHNELDNDDVVAIQTTETTVFVDENTNDRDDNEVVNDEDRLDVNDDLSDRNSETIATVVPHRDGDVEVVDADGDTVTRGHNVTATVDPFHNSVHEGDSHIVGGSGVDFNNDVVVDRDVDGVDRDVDLVDGDHQNTLVDPENGDVRELDDDEYVDGDHVVRDENGVPDYNGDGKVGLGDKIKEIFDTDEKRTI